MSLRPFGDRAFLLEFEQRIDPLIVERARAIADDWEARGIGEAIPAYASVVLGFDPSHTPRAEARAAADTIAAGLPPARPKADGRLVLIPTTYDGPDLAAVATRSGVTEAQLVEWHAGREYQAFFLGFMPGLAYCGLLDPRIDAPRLETPRPRVPAGSVGIANGQTAVYPFESPGGWRLIGRTDLLMFDPQRKPAALIQAGDRVRFVPR